MRSFVVALAVALTLAGVAPHAQQATPSPGGGAPPAFTTSSVKPSRAPEPGMSVDMPPGRLAIGNASLVFLIGAAFGVPASSIEGGPRWVRTDRFDVAGTSDPGRPREDMAAMLRTLLADRFKLVAHFEGRETPIYAMVVDREDGRLGPQLRRASVDCAAVQAQRGRGGAPPAPATADAVPLCSMQSAAGRLRASAIPLPTFAASLSPLARRPVRDRTGLGGGFDVDLQWMAGTRAAATPGGQGTPAAAVDTAAFFAALQEQLGLRLDPDVEAVDVLVIDRVETPTPD